MSLIKPRKYQGVELLKLSDTQYKTLDGRFEIYRDDEFETECDEPHPCRVTKNMRETYGRIREDAHNRNEAPHITKQRMVAAFGSAAYDAYQTGARGWYCYGNESHWYSQWVAWAGERDWTAEWVDNFTEAVSDLKAHLEVHPEERAPEAQAATVRKIAASYVIKDVTQDANNVAHVKAESENGTPVVWIVHRSGMPERTV